MPAEKKTGNEVPSFAPKKPEKRPLMVVPMDMKVEDLLRLDEQGSTDFVFDAKAMPEYDDEAVQKFGHELKKAYFLAYAEVRRRKEADALARRKRETPPQLWVEDPFERVAAKTERMAKEREAAWRGDRHATWIRNDQVEVFKEVGYKEIRVGKPGEALGEESGEWIKINESDKITLYFVEVSMETYEKVMKAASYKSQIQYSHDIENTYRQYVEGVNRDVGSRREVITPVVDMQDQKEVLSG
ncbi:MAG: hypothetical protein FJ109_20705 [Deltaproteobacteria bacterium]|nr:hypothetical protein [Deltaproteobacteria bacterium]